MSKTSLIITGIIAVAILAGAGVFVLRSKNVYPDQSKQLQAEDSHADCVANSDCMLVQNGWCKTVLAIGKSEESEWRVEDAKQTEIARQNAQTCELIPEGYLAVENFGAVCKQSKCVAEFIGD